MDFEKEELKITGTDDFDFSTLQQYTKLKKLTIEHCPLLTCLPELPATLTSLDCSSCPLLNKIYPSFDIKDINTINQFRICYYTEKYGKRILKRHKELRFNKYKQELMETSLRIYLHPNRICSLLESGLFTWGDLHLVV